MRKQTKRIISMCLVVVTMVTSIGYAPPPVFASSANSKILEAVEDLSDKDLASPSEAMAAGKEASPSEAEKTVEKASPSEVVKKFIRIEPEEIPEYYAQVSVSGKKFWKFEDRYGTDRYRDYGYMQGETEFPLWYEADDQGNVAEDINEEDEYYELAPYLYKSAAPAKTNWSYLSWKLLNDSESIFLFDKKESGSFKNWDHSTYAIWSVKGLVESDEEMEEEIQNSDLGYFFYGKISNEREPVNDWYYADAQGNISSIQNQLMASLLATTQHYVTFNRNAPGNLYITPSKSTITSDTYKLSTVGISSYYKDPEGLVFDKVGIQNYSFLFWVDSGASLPQIACKNSNGNGNTVYVNGSPCDTNLYVGQATIYDPTYVLDWTKNYYSPSLELNAVWMGSQDYGAIFWATEDGSMTWGTDEPQRIQAIMMRRAGTGKLFEVSKVTKPTKPGYTFKCWSRSYYQNGEYVNQYLYDGDTFYGETTYPESVHPVFEANENTIRFIDIDGNLLEEKKVLSGDTPVAPTPPEIPGKVFTGWDRSFTNVTGDLTVKAQYKDTVTVTLIGNGGAINGNDTYTEEVVYGYKLNSKLDEIALNTKRQGYTFKGWFATEDGSGYSYYNTSGVTEDITLYAKWVRTSNNVYYYRNYDSSDTTLYTGQSVYSGDEIGELKSLTRDKGYRLKGWYLNQSGTGEQVNPDYIMSDTSLKLYAKWETFEVTYNLHLGVDNPGFATERKLNSSLNGEVVTTYLPNKTSSSLIIPGYLNNYYTDKDDKILYSGWYPTEEVVDVYLKRTAKYIYFNLYYPNSANTSYYSTATTTSPYNTYGTIINTANMTAINNYLTSAVTGTKVFKGFYADQAGTKPIDFSLPLTPADTVTTDNYIRVIVYAVYANKKSKLTFKDWDGKILDEQIVKYGNPIMYPQNPIRAGYVFDGWDKELGTVSSLVGDTEVKAKYKLGSYQLTLDGNGGTLSGESTIEKSIDSGKSIDSELTAAKDSAHRKFYTFDGWYTTPIGGSKYPENGNQMPDTDLTLYAHWKRNTSEVIFNDGNGTTLDKQEIPIGGNAVPPEVPERTGYTFVGWDKPYTNIQDHTTITAQYSINSYELTLDGNGGTLAGNETKAKIVDFGESLDQILSEGKNDAVHKYYTLEGWYTAPSSGSKYPESGNQMPDMDLTIYAHWVRSSSEVVFKDWNGNVLDKQEVSIGRDATPPEVPERTGYIFVGWDKPYTNIQDHATITARYTINSHKLTLNGNEGTLAGDETKEKLINYGESFDQSLADGKNEAVRKYYTFAGWYTTPSGGSKYPESGNLMPNTEVTVYAHWERKSSEVIFEDWKGTILEQQEVAIGADAIPPEVPERSGYTFNCWDKSYTNIQDHITITAKYTINGYLLTLDGNGGTLAGNVRKDHVLSFNQSFDQVLKDGRDLVSRQGYSFDGWYTSPSGGSSYLYSGNQMPAINVTVFAHWTPNTYKVTFDPDHVRWTGEVRTEEHTFDTRLGTLPTPELYGWRFAGWWTGKNGTGTEVTNDFIVEPKDAVYYGEWEPETYQVRFISRVEQPEGESVQTFTVGLRYDQAFGNLPVPEEKGYSFIGWYDEDNKKVDSQTIFNPVSDADGKTYYAGWKANTYQIRFVYNDSDGKPVTKEIDGTYGTQFGTLPSPEKPGYTFVGWFRDNGEEVTAGSWVEPGDTEYKARWSANQYTIHFERNLPESDVTENPADKTVTYGFPIGELPILQETGYLFLGWYTESTGGNRIKETTFAALGDQTYYAHWVTGWIDNGNGTYSKPGTDGKWYTPDDELWWKGRDGIAGTDDDKLIHTLPGGGYYVDNGDGTHIRPGTGGSWKPGDTEHWWNGPDGNPGTPDDKLIHVIPGGGSYVDNGDGTNIRPGNGGSWKPGETEHWQNGPDGVPGTPDDYKKDSNGNTDPEPTKPDPTKPDPTKPEPTKPDPIKPDPTKPEPTKPEPSKPEPSNETKNGKDDGKEIVIPPTIPSIDSTSKPSVRNDGGTFKVNPDNPHDVTYTKPDGTPANNEWIGDGTDLYHVNEDSKLDYDWFLGDEVRIWFMLNNKPGEKFGAALRGWYSEPMDEKKYFFDPTTTKMLTGWQKIDNKWYYFTTKNEGQTYFGSNRTKWKYDPLRAGKPYGSMYKSEYTPDGFWVNENGVCVDK